MTARTAYSVAALVVLCLAAESPAAAAERPNIVMILADDLGWADIGCYGADLHETPNLDRLARQGMRFTNAYAAAPVCSPTRASIMTGKYPARLGMTIWSEASARPPQTKKLIPPITLGDLPHEQVTIAEVLKGAGYFTAHVGKWHLGQAAYYPQTQGFDINIGGTFWGAPTTFFYPYSGSGRWGNEFRYVPHLELGEEGEYLTDRLTDEALGIMEKVKDKPFFLNLWYHTVHTPIEGKPELVEYYKRQVKPGMHHQNYEYAAMVHSLDENVGRIMKRIAELGIEERTIVIFLSDNGGLGGQGKTKSVTSNYPLRSGKGSLYEGGTRVSMIVKWPNVTRAGSVCNQPVSSIDLYPSILDITSLAGDPDHNPDVDAVSIAQLLKNPTKRLDRKDLYWHYPHYYATTGPVSAIRQGDWKLLEYHEDGRLELYNLADDLGESNDLAKQKPDLAKKLQKQIHDWRRSANAQMPAINPEHPTNVGGK